MAGWLPANQNGHLIGSARSPEGEQQPGNGVRIVDGYVGCRIAGKESLGVLSSTGCPQGVQQPGDHVRVVEGGVGGWLAGEQDGHLIGSARNSQRNPVR